MAAVNSCVQYIVDELTVAGFAIELDTFTEDTPIGRKKFTNISKPVKHEENVGSPGGGSINHLPFSRDMESFRLPSTCHVCSL